MTRGKRTQAGMVDLVEHAVALVRESGWGTLSLYYLGAMPFVALFVLYFAEMAVMAYDPNRLVMGALLLGVFFVWMKVWQAVYACLLWDRLQGRSGARESRHWLRLAARQAFLQPFGLLLLPLSLIAIMPYGAAYAYFQNLTVLDGGRDLKPRELSREARRRAVEEPRQALLLVWAVSPSLMIFTAALVYLVTPLLQGVLPDWLMAGPALLQGIALLLFFPLSPLPVLLAANVLFALAMGPMLLQMLLGISTTFTESGGIWTDALALITVAGIVYLLLDPLVKAAFVLRCFRGAAAHTGEDLRVALRRTRPPSTAALLLSALAAAALLGGNAVAQEPAAPAVEPATTAASAVPPDQLDSQLDEVLKDRSYAWRIPGKKDLSELGMLGAFFDGIGRTIKNATDWVADKFRRFLDWLDRWRSGGRRESAVGGVIGVLGALGVNLLLLALLAVLLCIAAILFLRHWQAQKEQAPLAAESVAEARPDLADENTLATDLPDDEWARMALQLAGQGDYRGALRASFLSMLASLAAQDFVRVARAKSNREYAGELARRAHARPDCLNAFSQGVSVFEPVWYGDHPATPGQVEQLINLGERLRRGELV